MHNVGIPRAFIASRGMGDMEAEGDAGALSAANMVAVAAVAGRRG